MTPKRYNQHRRHQMHINWALTNAHGNPALCCSECVQPSGKRKGKPAYIDWLNTATIRVLQDMHIEERHSESQLEPK
jgi:hypothetical protein